MSSLIVHPVLTSNPNMPAGTPEVTRVRVDLIVGGDVRYEQEKALADAATFEFNNIVPSNEYKVRITARAEDTTQVGDAFDAFPVDVPPTVTRLVPTGVTFG